MILYVLNIYHVIYVKYIFSDTFSFVISLIVQKFYIGNSWAFLIAQLVKNPPTMQETPVRFLNWKDPLEMG